jgi:alkylation response protein AidB-like acyl-CoA dehydrogenase
LEFTVNDYQAPQRDMKFVMNELLDYPAHYAALPNCEDASIEIVDAIREEGAKFSTNVLAPINKVGDQEGCTWIEGEVTTPTGFKEAYNQFKEAGWPGLIQEEKYGGQGLPFSVGLMFNEMISSANLAWSMLNGANNGTVETIDVWGTPEQKNIYLTKIISGDWSGTMCLTESHCGTDLGMLRTKAEPNSDGSYNITGTKIFITQGEHDLSENIVHIVLARMPNAPAGVKGISLFIVPKFTPDQNGEVGERNGVTCGSIEHKMGINGSPTCVMNFDGSKGYLLGAENKGINCMFTFMNNARLGVAMQGMVHAELGFQKSLAYAKDRLQMRSLSGVKNPNGPADPIIVHPDVRRMLLTQKSLAEGGRMLNYHLAKLLDVLQRSDDEQLLKETEDELGLLTPIAKAFLTETGFESANLALQCFGGHGYIKEWEVEQNVRDSRIACIYEGTTGIQALDLLGRKILMTKGERLRNYTKKMDQFCEDNKDNQDVAAFVNQLSKYSKEWGDLVTKVGGSAMQNPDEMGAASVDFLMYSGYVVLAYFWAQAAVTAHEALKTNEADKDFYLAKIKTARFFFERMLPKTRGYVATMNSGAENLMALEAEHFSF